MRRAAQLTTERQSGEQQQQQQHDAVASPSSPRPPPPHQATPQIPHLASAPPSGNADWTTNFQQQQQVTMATPVSPSSPTTSSGNSNRNSPTTKKKKHTSTTLPPPPAVMRPPPPPPPATAAPFSSTTTTTGGGLSAGSSLVVPPLPPPPPMMMMMKNMPQQQRQPQQQSRGTTTNHHHDHQGSPNATTTTTTTAFATHKQFPLPPPPPPPPVPPATTRASPPPSPASPTPPTTTTTTSRVSHPPPLEPKPLPTITTTNNNNNNNNITGMTFLAQRQTHIPVLVVASEAAHGIAWKNGIRLADLLSGLYASQQQQQQTASLPAFRSITKALTLQWSDLQVQFIESCTTHSAQAAQVALQQGAALAPNDGNLEQELNLLEDQVDNLLQEESSSSSLSTRVVSLDNNNNNDASSLTNNNNTTTSSSSSSLMDNPMEWYETRQRQLEQVTKDAFSLTSSLTIPWLWRYRQALDASTDNLEHDLMACPPLLLLVCTTHEPTQEDVVDICSSLESPHYLPKQFTNGLWSTQYVRRQILVLHDNVEGPANLDEGALSRRLAAQFGTAATLLRTNSISRETAAALAQEETSDLWGGNGTLGNCLSVSDRVKLRQYLTNLVTTALLPAMERRITELNVIVSDRKKGVRNVLKSLWRTGKKDEEAERTMTNTASGSGGHGGGGGAGSTDHVYRYDTIEAQTRLLADSLFLMRDYDAAYHTYRLIRDDYKQDRAMAHYGSCQELMAICLHFVDPYGRAREMFSNIENALLSYSKAAEEERVKFSQTSGGRPSVAPPSTRMATRLCLVMIHSKHICAGRHLEVADLLASASAHETALGAAVLLEQASAHYFHNEMYRKYAFHMLMSGHMYRAAEQEHHAFRCFTSALCIYRDGRWEELHNHVRSALAAQLYSMGRMSIALQLYAKLLGSTNGGRVSIKSQQKFVSHVLDICNEHPKKALAGADRMAAGPNLQGGEREKVRKTRLDRIVQVIRFTKTASRVLELPNMDLPLVDDNSVVVIADEGARVATGENGPMIGKAGRGSPETWEQLTLEASAELCACHSETSQGKNDDITNMLLAKIENAEIRRVVAEIDKDKSRRTMAERSKRSPNYKPKPPVRALKEPITVEFGVRNPLGIPVDLYDMQLVARMNTSDNQVCTNEDAIKITPLVTYDQDRTWNFPTTDESFSAADFCRVSTGNSESQRWKSVEDMEPFFVVTKDTVTIEPESRRVVSLSVCPLVKGNMEIVGVRCRVFDDIWVFHPFNLKGELLQNTRSNRANRVRGESLLLKARIGEGMPCLTADLVAPMSDTGDPNSTIFQGQISKWNLRLSNVGTSPAKNIFLKCNSPWLTIWNGAEPDDDPNTQENKPVPFVMSPSGTLMSLPMEDFGLKVQGVIHPGESIDVAVDIRVSKSGKQNLYMLFRYDLAGEAAGETTHRWLRKMFEVDVHPSIEFHSSIMPSFASLGEHVLSLEVANLRNDKPHGVDLEVSSITLASRSCGIEPLLPSIESGISRHRTIGWQERLSAHYKITGPFEKSGLCQLNKDDLSLGESGLITRKPAAESTVLDFLRLERAYREFRQILTSHQKALARAALEQDDQNAHPRSIAEIRRANTSVLSGSESDNLFDSSPHSSSVARLFPKCSQHENAVLICNWKSVDNVISGVQFIRGISTLPPVEACPIAVTARYPSTMACDFSQGPALVGFEITFRNRLLTDTVNFEFAAEDPTDFDLTGASSLESMLQGGENTTVKMSALIPSSGVYNIQRIRITCKNEEPESFLFPVQWMVTVTDKK